MSFTESDQGTDTTENASSESFEGGVNSDVEASTESTDSQAAVEAAALLDIEQYSSHGVPISVDGQEQIVPLSELRNGYQRQADYTRKTQELASQREELALAEALVAGLREDPAETLRLLQEATGIGTEASSDDDRPLDPTEAKVQELERYIQGQQQEQARSAMQAEIDTIAAREGVDGKALLGFAVRNGIPDFEVAFSHMVRTDEQVRTAWAQSQANAEQARTEAKRGASFVGGGTNPSSSSAGVAAQPINSLRDAMEQARRELSR